MTSNRCCMTPAAVRCFSLNLLTVPSPFWNPYRLFACKRPNSILVLSHECDSRENAPHNTGTLPTYQCPTCRHTSCCAVPFLPFLRSLPARYDIDPYRNVLRVNCQVKASFLSRSAKNRYDWITAGQGKKEPPRRGVSPKKFFFGKITGYWLACGQIVRQSYGKHAGLPNY